MRDQRERLTPPTASQREVCALPANVKVGLVGAGYVSTYHARALRSLPYVDIVGIADSDQARAQALAQKFKIPRTFPALAALNEARPNVIHILTPPATHASLTLAA